MYTISISYFQTRFVMAPLNSVRIVVIQVKIIITKMMFSTVEHFRPTITTYLKVKTSLLCFIMILISIVVGKYIRSLDLMVRVESYLAGNGRIENGLKQNVQILILRFIHLNEFVKQAQKCHDIESCREMCMKLNNK